MAQSKYVDSQGSVKDWPWPAHNHDLAYPQKSHDDHPVHLVAAYPSEEDIANGAARVYPDWTQMRSLGDAVGVISAGIEIRRDGVYDVTWVVTTYNPGANARVTVSLDHITPGKVQVARFISTRYVHAQVSALTWFRPQVSGRYIGAMTAGTLLSLEVFWDGSSAKIYTQTGLSSSMQVLRVGSA